MQSPADIAQSENRQQIGITTKPEIRKQEWQRIRPSLGNWKILISGLTYAEAQALENYYIRNKGYTGSPGGPIESGAVYSVYTFSY